MFTVTNPTPKPGMVRILRRAAKANGLRLSELASDAVRLGRVFR